MWARPAAPSAWRKAFYVAKGVWMRIVLCYPVERRHLEQIRSHVDRNVEIVDAGQQHIAEEILKADVFCGHAKVPVDWASVVAQGRLKWIQSSAAGLDHCLVPEVIASEIVVSSASGVFAPQVAEHAIALMTSWLRGLPAFFRATTAGIHATADGRSAWQDGGHRGFRW